ncbi:MAG: NAD(P)H-hydrate dehydratase [Candidatus Hydrothermarchaeales archaeon]
MEYINPSDMRAIDINSAYFGVGFSELMQNAGLAVFEELKKIDGLREKRVAFLCGPANNGGDGLVAATLLFEDGLSPVVYLVGRAGDVKTREAKNALKKLLEKGGEVVEVQSAGEIDFDPDIIVDALLGTGLVGEPREPFKAIIKRVNDSNAYRISVDVPSGMGSRTTVRSDIVVCLHRAKSGVEGMQQIVVKDIGIPAKAETHVGTGNLITLLNRAADSHKGDNGRVMVVGGSTDYSGAPILTGLGAFGAGCDLATLFVPETIVESARTSAPDFIVRSYEGKHLNSCAVKEILDFSRGQDVCVIGPGLGVADETGEALNAVLSQIGIPVVIDADGLKQLDVGLLKRLNSVVTPHGAEFKLLTGDVLTDSLEERKIAIETWSKKLSTTILLKSQVDIIASQGGKILLNDTGNPGMTVGGTGDVLAGATAGFISQGLTPFDAAVNAAFVCGAAGDQLQIFKGFGYTASDVAREIPYTVKRFFDQYG